MAKSGLCSQAATEKHATLARELGSELGIPQAAPLCGFSALLLFQGLTQPSNGCNFLWLQKARQVYDLNHGLAPGCKNPAVQLSDIQPAAQTFRWRLNQATGSHRHLFLILLIHLKVSR